MRIYKILFLCFFLIFLPEVMGLEGAKFREKLDAVMKPLVAKKEFVGIVVGVITEKGQRIFSYGTISKNSKQAPDGKTIFEIGSISKVFTATLLSIMEQKKQLKLTDPINKFFPGKRVPCYRERKITLLDLITHHSGLPRMPTNWAPVNPLDPYVDYTRRELYQFLEKYKLTRKPGKKFEYSNLGVGLLGHILSLHAKKKYEDLILEKICIPLQMNDTKIKLSKEQKKRLAQGHLVQDPTTPCHWDVLAGAGALRSTTNDMLKFLAAQLGIRKSSLYKDMKRCHPEQRIIIKTKGYRLSIALGWHLLKTKKANMVWHNGGTYGFTSFAGFVPKKKFGVVILTNSFSLPKINQINQMGFQVLGLLLK